MFVRKSVFRTRTTKATTTTMIDVGPVMVCGAILRANKKKKKSLPREGPLIKCCYTPRYTHFFYDSLQNCKNHHPQNTKEHLKAA